ncbi:Bifunctional chorismate mutase/prephenate dehydratase [Psilocybe cubensis]|nr:Bifunctional chorismate mutase/prephenate dehydratase [Psilocybe cubensis]KAH9486840.1 Bifunctional chorismate mutase/prephenate dehydratase [Psilocybe cubensis]
MSHEQALGQCRDFIARKLPMVETVKTPSTAAAAKALLDNPPDCAAICSSICATLFDGLEILFNGIQNERSNFTRFFIIAYSQFTELPPVMTSNRHFKGLIRMSVPPPQAVEPESNRARGVVEYLKLLDAFTTRIDRRPALDTTPFSSIYFIEVQGNKANGTTFNSWALELEQVTSRINCAGGDASLLGVW